MRVTGTATYVGKAAGKASINPQLPGRDLMGGAFTADATLTANFEAGDEDLAHGVDQDMGAIKGMISNIMTTIRILAGVSSGFREYHG